MSMSSTSTVERRRSPRLKPAQLVYIEFGRDNGGMIKNVSQGGMRFFLMNPVIAGHKLQFGMTIDAARRMEGDAVIVWTDASGKSGSLSFAGLLPEAQEILRGWLAEMDAPPPVRNFPAVTAGPPAPTATPPQSAGALPPAVPELSPAIAAIPAPPAEAPASIADTLLPSAPPVPSYDAPRLATRDEWRRAARENLSPVEKSTPEKMLAEITEELTGSARPLPRDLRVPPEIPLEPRIPESALHLTYPSRGFLTSPLSRSETLSAEASSLQDPVLEASLDQLNFAVTRTTVSRSRLAMILALAAICGAAAAFAAIAYRRNVGESLIAIGEKISGGSRPASATNLVPPNSTAPPVSPDAAPSVTPQDARPVVHTPSSEVSPVVRPPVPLKSNAPSDQPAARDATPAKPKFLELDVSSLWIAVENGDAAAEVALANRYISGDGVTKNCDQARVLLEAAAKRGNPAATKRLAELPATGCE